MARPAGVHWVTQSTLFGGHNSAAAKLRDLGKNCVKRPLSLLPSMGARVLFFSGSIVGVAILLWIHHLRLSGNPNGIARIFYVLFAYDDYWAAASELLLLVAALFIASITPAQTILKVAGSRPWLIAFASVPVLCAGAVFVYHDHPLSMDEYAAYFQAQVFATGHIAGKFPVALKDWLIPPGFQNFFLQISPLDGRVASTYWPGHALIMTPFAWLGIPWACNPVISALTLIIVHRLSFEIFGNVEAAGLALLLTLASPVFFGNGISYYSMPSHLLLNSTYALLLLRPTGPKALVAGLVGSISLCLHNPVPHILFSLPWLVWVITRPDGIKLFSILLAGYLPLSMLLGIGWFEFSNQLRSSGTSPGSHEIKSTLSHLQDILASTFTLPSLAVLLARAIGIAKIWVWAVPGLLTLACIGAFGWWRNPICRLFVVSAFATLVGYLFFPADQGHGWGFRYFHSAWMALPLLATATLYQPTLGSETSDSSNLKPFRDDDTKRFLVACTMLTLVFGVGWRAWNIQDFMAEDIAQVPHYNGHEHRIVFLDYRFTFYGADLVQNDPFLRGNEIRMFSHGIAEDARMMAQYYPSYHRVYADLYGTVWSERATPQGIQNSRQRK